MTAVHPMWMNYPELHEELKQVKKLMKDSIQIENKTIKDAILSVLDSGGKNGSSCIFDSILYVE